MFWTATKRKLPIQRATPYPPTPQHRKYEKMKNQFCSIHYIPTCSLILNLILVFVKVAYFDELLMIYFFCFLDIFLFGHVLECL